MREIAIRVPVAGVEPVLDDLLPLAPHGVFDVQRGDEVELRVRGHEGEMPSRADIAATAGPWLRWSGERDVPDDWREQRRLDSAPLLVAGGLSIRSQWAAPPAGRLVDIVLDDRHRAFGSGLHPTTLGCLEALAERRPHGSFADLGCGSGVLSIAAAKLGLAPVMALDCDPAAVQATQANAEANEVVVEVREMDLSTEPPPQADVVAANLTADLHLRLGERFAPAPPRLLIAAGMRADEAELVAAGYAGSAGLRVRSRRGTDEWPVLELG